MRRACLFGVSGFLLLLGAGAAAAPGPVAVVDPALTGGHGGSKPEIEEPVLADLLRRLRTTSPLLAAALARHEAALLRNRLSGFGPEPPTADPEVLERQAEVAVSTLFARIYEIDRELEVHKAGRDLLDLLKEAAASRYVAGQSGQEELVQAQLEALHASERRIELESRRTELVADLNLQVGFPATTPLGSISLLPAQLPPPRGANFEASANAPLLRAARARLREAEKRPEKVPDDLQNAEIEAARAELRAAEARVQTEVARFVEAWNREENLLAHARDGLLPQSGLLFEASRTSYLAGRATFSAVVEALRMWLESRTEIARHESARFVAGAELEALLLPASATAPSAAMAPPSESEP